MAESITITDNRTGESLEIPIDNGGVDAAEWRKLLPGIWFHDPGLATTSGADSAITELDGENGILRYRGYPIEQLAQQSTFLEVSYLLIHGELPTQAQLDAWVHEITHHTFLHEKFRTRMYDAYHYDAHPMGLLTSSVAGLSTFYPEAKDIDDPDVRMKQIVRLIAKMPTMAASAHRHAMGLPYVFPDNALDYPSNFLNMMFQVGNPYEIHPALHKAMEILLILHADHEQELLDHGRTGGRIRPRRPVQLGCRSRRCPLRPSPRRRQRGGAQHARRHRQPRQCSRLHRKRQGRRGTPDGLRPPGVQELRPLALRSSRTLRTTSSRSPARTRVSTLR